MAKVTSIKDLAAMIDALETPAMTMNDDLVVNADPMVKIYEETLPVIKVNDTDYRLTLKDADAVRQHDANFLEVYGKVASGLIVEKAKADAELAAMNITTVLHGVLSPDRGHHQPERMGCIHRFRLRCAEV